MTEPIPPGEEGIVYADCDLEAQVGPKLRHDVVGQYQRPDVVALLLDREPRSSLIEVDNNSWDEVLEDGVLADSDGDGHADPSQGIGSGQQSRVAKA